MVPVRSFQLPKGKFRRQFDLVPISRRDINRLELNMQLMSMQSAVIARDFVDFNWLRQYSLATYFVVMTTVAVCCVVHDSLSFWIVFPYGCLIAARTLAKLQLTPNLAWGLFLIGWVSVFSEIAYTHITTYYELDRRYFYYEIAQNIIHSYLARITLPVVFSIWAIPLLFQGLVNRRSPTRKWLLIFLVIVNIDLAALSVMVCSLVGAAHGH